MEFMKEKIAALMPVGWKLIEKDNYKNKGVYEAKEFEILAAYEANGVVLTVNTYPEIEDFIFDYNNEMKEIVEKLKGQDWEKISFYNPLVYKYIKINSKKIYVSIFEVVQIPGIVSVQLFYDDKQTFGFLFSAKKEETQSLENFFKSNEIAKNVVKLIL